ncbi:bleomycin resistance protein [Nocardioides cynanchi]|uniref:bleomycin resistance protein n=1 Tax=Nocardioides cynanchi TaxID=2558918 RepID=UPI001248E7D8|nr:VOC family protein [Nocardioides cynanchi]
MTAPRPYRLGRAAPTVPTRDLTAALGFYVGVLGMAETFRNGDPVGFVIVERDDAEIHLTLQPGHRATTANVLHLMVDDADALHERVTAAGVRIVKGIRDADYAMRTFVMADPDGNRIDVGQDL